MSPTIQAGLLIPLEIWEVPLDNSVIKFFQPLILQPRKLPHDPDDTDDTEYAEVVYPKLNIDVYANNHDDLLEAVYSNIRLEWQHFVQQDDAGLRPETLQIKRNYLDMAGYGL